MTAFCLVSTDRELVLGFALIVVAEIRKKREKRRWNVINIIFEVKATYAIESDSKVMTLIIPI